MKRLLTLLCATAVILGVLSGPALADQVLLKAGPDQETAREMFWLGPVTIQVLYSVSSAAPLHVMTADGVTFVIPADDLLNQSLARTAFIKGGELWYQKSEDYWTALAVGGAPR